MDYKKGERAVKAMREPLAEYAHSSWSGWMHYMFSKSTMNDDGSITIPKESAERWTRHMHTKYKDLPESEKKSDRAEADKMISIMQGFGFGFYL